MKTKKKTVFYGAATALVTPFCNGEIDYAALAKLIDMQIESGIGALVIGGTTGEAATLSDDERVELYKFCAEHISGRAKLILGTGTNDTRAALRHTKLAERLKADAALLVTPYYNKGTEGYEAYYEKEFSYRTFLTVGEEETLTQNVVHPHFGESVSAKAVYQYFLDNDASYEYDFASDKILQAVLGTAPAVTE